MSLSRRRRTAPARHPRRSVRRVLARLAVVAVAVAGVLPGMGAGAAWAGPADDPSLDVLPDPTLRRCVIDQLNRENGTAWPYTTTITAADIAGMTGGWPSNSSDPHILWCAVPAGGLGSEPAINSFEGLQYADQITSLYFGPGSRWDDSSPLGGMDSLTSISFPTVVTTAGVMDLTGLAGAADTLTRMAGQGAPTPRSGSPYTSSVAGLGALVNLTVLQITNGHLTTSGMAGLENLTHLTSLGLSTNRLDDGVISLINQARAGGAPLTVLDVSTNQIGRFDTYTGPITAANPVVRQQRVLAPGVLLLSADNLTASPSYLPAQLPTALAQQQFRYVGNAAANMTGTMPLLSSVTSFTMPAPVAAASVPPAEWGTVGAQPQPQLRPDPAWPSWTWFFYTSQTGLQAAQNSVVAYPVARVDLADNAQTVNLGSAVDPATPAYTYSTPSQPGFTVPAFTPTSYAVAPGSTLPSGVSLNATTGELSGTPATAGSYSFVIQVTGTSATNTNITILADRDIEVVEAAAASLTLDKEGELSSGGTVAVAGDTITYTFTVTNDGTSTATLDDISIDDPLLGGPVSMAEADWANATTPGELLPGEWVTVTADYTLTPGDVTAGEVENTATATAADPNDDPVTDDDTATVEFDPGARLTVTKALGGVGRADDADEFILRVRTGSAAGTAIATTPPTTGAGATIASGGSVAAPTQPVGTQLWVTEELADGSASTRANYTARLVCTDPTTSQVLDQDLGAGGAITLSAAGEWACTVTNTANLTALLVQKEAESGSGWVGMAGSEWEIRTSPDGPASALATVTELGTPTGRFEVTDLPYPGSYALVETAAPDGFSLLAAPVTFEIDEDGTVALTGPGSSNVTLSTVTGPPERFMITVRDVPSLVLPEAGGPGDWWLRGPGAALVLAAALATGLLWLAHARRRRRLAVIGLGSAAPPVVPGPQGGPRSRQP